MGDHSPIDGKWEGRFIYPKGVEAQFTMSITASQGDLSGNLTEADPKTNQSVNSTISGSIKTTGKFTSYKTSALNIRKQNAMPIMTSHRKAWLENAQQRGSWRISLHACYNWQVHYYCPARLPASHRCQLMALGTIDESLDASPELATYFLQAQRRYPLESAQHFSGRTA
jgi:hypothetical protein